MSHEQNIDDILKLLKQSVEQEEQVQAVPKVKKSGNLSAEALKASLKQQYGTETEEDAELSASAAAYALDPEVLDALASEPKEEISEECPFGDKPIKEELTPAFDKVLVDDPEEEVVELVENEELLEESIEKADETIEEEVLPEKTNEVVEKAAADEIAEEALQEAFPFNEELEPLDMEDAPWVEMEELISDEALSAESDEEYQDFPPIQQIALTELIGDYGAAEEAENGAEDAVEEIVLEPVLDDIPEDVGVPVNDSVLELMLQLGCEEELETVSDEAVTEEFAADESDFVAKEGEYSSEEQIVTFRSAYARRNILLLLQVLGVGALSLISLIYDLAPILKMKFSGILDYTEYMSSYMLIGMQIMLLGAVCLGKPILRGFQHLFTLHANRYSVVGLMTAAVMLYDICFLFVDTEQVPAMFHFLCLAVMLLVKISEWMSLRREMTVFSVYSASGRKYTVHTEEGEQTVAQTMYAGGLDRNKKVVLPKPLEFPHGFLQSMEDKDGKTNRLMSFALIPAALFSIIAGVLVMILGKELAMALETALTVLFSWIPLGAILCEEIPLMISARRLKKRGIALTGTQQIRTYGDSHVMVFRDMHLFAPCDPRDTGMVFYEQEQTADIFGCLYQLYARIGGPMAGLFEQVPETCRNCDIRIRRITRTGVEAFADGRHVLLVGDPSFMKRYGLRFPEDGKTDGRATLCVSLDGKVSAKMNVRYRPTKVFEMLTERLAKENIECAVETFDPLISAALVAKARQLGTSPISVIHKNGKDLKSGERHVSHHREAVGLLVLASRLKLAEALVWCRRICRVRSRVGALVWILGSLGIVGIVLLLTLGQMVKATQYWILFWALLTDLIVWIVTVLGFPKRSYFTEDTLAGELARVEAKQIKKQSGGFFAKIKNKR